MVKKMYYLSWAEILTADNNRKKDEKDYEKNFGNI